VTHCWHLFVIYSSVGGVSGCLLRSGTRQQTIKYITALKAENICATIINLITVMKEMLGSAKDLHRPPVVPVTDWCIIQSGSIC